MARVRPFCLQWLFLLAFLGSFLWGCAPRETQPSTEEASETEIVPSEVRLLVVDDAGMSTAIEQLRAEWKARTGATIILSQANSADLVASETLADKADAVIYPSRLIGTFVERNLIVPLPADYKSNRELAWGDTFELLQVAESTWGKTPYAVPFGSPVFTCYFRPDLLELQHKSPPRYWKEYHELADLLGRRENLKNAAPPDDAPWYGSLQPLAAGSAGRVLLARAAAYAKHRDHFSTLFDIETMEPLIAGPAFVRALEELVADAKLGPPDQIEMDVDEVRREFLAGHAALAMTWPGHAGSEVEKALKPTVAVGFAELPGSPVVYNFVHHAWEKRADREPEHVPLLAAAGRLGSVASGSADPASAFRLLAWLAGREWGPAVSSASRATTLYRQSQLRAPQPWLNPGTDAEAAQAYATSVSEALSQSQYLCALRIPGEDRYLEALDKAVHAVLRQEKSPTEALRDAAAIWKSITESLGVEAQRNAYRQSVGM